MMRREKNLNEIKKNMNIINKKQKQYYIKNLSIIENDVRDKINNINNMPKFSKNRALYNNNHLTINKGGENNDKTNIILYSFVSHILFLSYKQIIKLRNKKINLKGGEAYRDGFINTLKRILRRRIK